MTSPAAKTFTFSLVLNGFHEPTAEIEDALYEAGCDDSMLTFRGPAPVLEFDRQAQSFEQAITSAIADVEKAAIDAIVLRIEPDDLVNAAEIARRSGKSREAVRLWVEGKRGAGDFPPPVALLERSTLWSWQEVAAWLARKEILDPDSVGSARVIAAVNSFLEQQRTTSMRADIDRVSRTLSGSAMVRRLREMRTGATD